MRLVCWACGALFLFLLTACSDDSSSSAAQPTGSTPPPSVTSSLADPSPSPERQTPEEFVRAWVAEYNAMQNTGDTERFRKMSRRCETCSLIADQVDAIYSAGGSIQTQGWTMQSIKLSKPDERGRLAATIEVSSAPSEIQDSADTPVRTLSGGRFINRLSLNRVAARWNVYLAEKVAQ